MEDVKHSRGHIVHHPPFSGVYSVSESDLFVHAKTAGIQHSQDTLLRLEIQHGSSRGGFSRQNPVLAQHKSARKNSVLESSSDHHPLESLVREQLPSDNAPCVRYFALQRELPYQDQKAQYRRKDNPLLKLSARKQSLTPRQANPLLKRPFLTQGLVNLLTEQRVYSRRNRRGILLYHASAQALHVEKSPRESASEDYAADEWRKRMQHLGYPPELSASHGATSARYRVA